MEYLFFYLVAGEGCGCPVDTSVQSTEAPTEAAAENLNQFAQRLCLCLHTQNIVVSHTAVSDTPCFSFFSHPLHRPPGARVPETPCHEPTRAHPHRGRWFKSFSRNAKKEKVLRMEYLFFYLVAGEGLEPTTSGL